MKVRRTRGTRTGVVLGWVLLGCVAVVTVAGVWTAVDALRVRDHLVEAASIVPQLEDQVLAGDDEAVATSVEILRDAASNAVNTTGRPHWTLTSWLPGVGPNVRAVQTLAGTVSDLAEGPLPSLPAVVAAASPAALAPEDGRVDVQSVEDAASVVIAADDGVNAAIESLASIDRDALLPQVNESVDQLAAELSDLRLSTATASRAAQLIPPMMGIDEPRDYLVLVQNNAEPRALGGIVGSVLLLRADDGKLTLMDQVAGNEIFFADPVQSLTNSETALFGTQFGRYMVNVTSTPDFPRAAEIATKMWSQNRGGEISGVLSIDPIVLADLLASTGPVSTDAGILLTSETAASYLLNQIYLDEPDPALQDVFFADAATSIFEAVTQGEGDATAAVRGLVASAEDGRLMLWSSDESEQALISDTNLSGRLESAPDGSEFGVFLNDGSGSKIGYYVRSDIEVEALSCRADGSMLADIHVRIESDVRDVESLTSYITGIGEFVDPGTFMGNLLVYSPEFAVIESASAGSNEIAVQSQQHSNRSVAATTVVLKPGERLEYVFSVRTSGNTPFPASIRTTPDSGSGSVTFKSGCAGS